MPRLDNSAVLHTIEITSATWMQDLPVLQTQISYCVQFDGNPPAGSEYAPFGVPAAIEAGRLPVGTPIEAASCEWTGMYTGWAPISIPTRA